MAQKGDKEESSLPAGAISSPFVPAVINQDIGHYAYYPHANQFMTKKEEEGDAEKENSQYPGPFVKPAIYTNEARSQARAK
jgi:hypothetical protein